MSGNHPTIRVTNCDTVKDDLEYVHALLGWSWRKMTLTGPYSGIPAGTLCSIAKTSKVPKKWRERRGLPALAPAPVCPIHGVVHTGRCPRPRKPRQPWMSGEECDERLDWLEGMFE
jgi:hypothetical protein